MSNNRRGFISNAAGLGVFTISGGTMAGTGVASIDATDVLIAMPGDRYFAVPAAALAPYAVKAETFAAEEARRGAAEAADTVRTRGNSPPPPPPPPPPRPRYAAMGVRG